jgi:hypothetical protein
MIDNSAIRGIEVNIFVYLVTVNANLCATHPTLTLST